MTLLPNADPGAPVARIDATTQRAAWALGLGGLIPFLFCALMAAAGPVGWQAVLREALILYGATILSFLGAVHWGLALHARAGEERAGPARLALGVLPALVAWVATLLPPAWDAGLLVLGLLATVGVEQWAALKGLVPGNYMLLRWAMTAGAIVSLLIGGL